MTTEIVPASARPLYDVLHLGNVLSRGHSPTSGEMTWAVVDDCFVIADVLSLAAIQPEGAVAAVAVRSEVKAAAREGAGRPAGELAEAGGEAAGKSLALSRARASPSAPAAQPRPKLPLPHAGSPAGGPSAPREESIRSCNVFPTPCPA